MKMNTSIARRPWIYWAFAGAALLSPSVSLAQTVPADEWVEIPAPQDQTLQNLNIPADANEKGMWSPVFSWPMNGLHSALLPDGRVLTFGTSLDGVAQNGRWYDVWDPALGFDSNAHDTIYDPARQDSFCAAAIYLPDGSMMISGGNGSDTSTIYDSASHSSYTANERMAEARWYPTLINLADGRPIILGGMMPYTEQMQDQPDQAIANGWPSMTPEVYENGQWRSLFGAYSRIAFGPDYLRTSYPRAWVAPDGRVFGISTDQMWYLDPNANNNQGVVTSAGVFKGPPSASAPLNVGPTNTAAMFAPGQILQVGGNGGFNGEELPASNMATLIDINGGSPVLIEQPPMSKPRRYPNAVVLANGEVVITGGATYGNFYAGQPAQSVQEAEIWNPTTNSWEVGASAAVYRGYHSITTLLANGAVLSTGGGTPGPVTNLNGEIYYPPYLFESNGNGSVLAPRPVMSGISGLTYDHGAALQIDMANSEAISQLVLIGTSNGTHSFNSGQRRIPLNFSQQKIRLTATIPNANLTPPGYYQVVAIGANGTPSYGTIIGIGQNQAEPPVITTPYDPPNLDYDIQTPVVFPDQSASYSVTAVAGFTYSWEVSDGTKTSYSSNAGFSHTFTAPGLYTVTVNARDANSIVTSYTFVQAVSTPVPAASSTQSSQLLLDDDNHRLWVANPDNDTVSVLDTQTQKVIAEIAVGDSPRNLAMGAGDEIWVTNKYSASISVLDRNTLSVKQTVALPRGSQPHGLVFNASGNTAFVALEASGELLAIEQDTKQVGGTLFLGQNIRHIGYDATHDQLLVSRFITPPLDGEDTDNVLTQSGGGEVLVVRVASLSLVDTVILQHSNQPDTSVTGSGIPNYLGAAAISPDGQLAWVPSKQDNIARGTLRNGQPLDFQNSVRAISSVIDLNTLAEDYSRRADHDNAGLSSAATYHPNGVYLFVALETSREVAVMNAFTGGELFRIPVDVAPQALAIAADGLTLYVKNFMSRTVTIADLTSLITTGQLQAEVVASVGTVQEEALSPAVLLGKTFFYDAKDPRLALDAYLSCASCHNDGGQDGRTWDFTNFGEGLRNTIELKGRGNMTHGLLHWSGNFDEVQDFETQIRNFAGGTGLMSDADFFRTSVEAEAFENTSLVAPLTQSVVDGRTVMSWQSEGQMVFNPTETTDGQLHFSVKATAASMTLFAIVDLPSPVDDSFYFRLDGVDTDFWTFNNQATTGFEEREIFTWDGLTVGQTYNLRILRREDGSLLDSFHLTGGQFSNAKKAGFSTDLDALAAYLGSLQGDSADRSFGPSPYRAADGGYTVEAQAGEATFAAQCTACHGGIHFTNSSDEQAFTNIGTLNAASGQRKGGPLTELDTPTLRGVWATAPYLHNGSAATLAEAISAHQGLSLTSSELSDVVAYVQQIDGNSPPATGGVYFDVQQAEDHNWMNGQVETNQPGYAGNGFVSLAGSQNNWMQFDLDLPARGEHTLTLRYANGGNTQSVSVVVNGAVQITNLALPPTGSWSNWSEVSMTVNLNAGLNAVRLIPANGGGSPVIEAEAYENTSLVAPLAQSNVGGRTVMSWPGTGQIMTAPEDNTPGQLHYSVTATASSMTLFAFVDLFNYNDDSFFYQLEEVDTLWWTFNNQATSGFEQREIHTWNGLSVGQTYTLKIMRREDGALMDYFELSGGLFGGTTEGLNLDQLTIEGNGPPPANRTPIVVQTIADQTLEVGTGNSINLDTVFNDPDDDSLDFDTSASANVSVSGNTLQLQGTSMGSEVITVSADDGRGGQVAAQFNLTVTPANIPPQVVSAITDTTLVVGEPGVTYDLDSLFSDTDGDALSFSATPSPNVVLQGNQLQVNATQTETATITVSASDGRGGIASFGFTLEVSMPNRAPEITGVLSDQTREVGDSAVNIALDTVFSDPDGDALSYTLSGANSNVQLAGSTLTITAASEGTTLHTITASDGEYEVSTAFGVTVNPPQDFEFFSEAEAQTWLDSTVDSNHAGYSGIGFVNTANYAGNWVELTLDVPSSGDYRLTIRYANGSSNRPQAVAVNGTTQISSLNMNGTGAWANWATQSTTVFLTAGSNTIRLTSLASGGAPNIDWYSVVTP